MTQPPPNMMGKNAGYRRPIALIGGSVRAAAVDAKHAGYQVLAIDRFGDADLLDSCHQWFDFENQPRWIDILGRMANCPIVPLGGFSWACLSNAALVRDSSLKTRLIAYPDLSTLSELDSPKRLAEIAHRCGVGFPETWQCLNGKLIPLAQAGLSPPEPRAQWLVKPKNHAGGVGISFADQSSLLVNAEYRQRRISGRPIGVNFVSVPTATNPRATLLGVFGGITYRRNRSHPFLYGGSYGPLVLPTEVMEKLASLGQFIANAFSLRGLFNVDLILSPNQTLWLLEINPRYSASMELINLPGLIPQSLDGIKATYSLIDMHLACYQNRLGIAETIGHRLSEMKDACSPTLAVKRIVYAKRDFARPQSSLALLDLDVTPPSHATQFKLVDLPASDAAIQAGEPICTVIQSGFQTEREAIRVSALVARRVRSAHRIRANHQNGLFFPEANGYCSPRSSANE